MTYKRHSHIWTIGFFVAIVFYMPSCKKYECECKTEFLSHSPTGNPPPTYSSKQISAISKSRAIIKCKRNDHSGGYGSTMTTCQIK